MKRWSVPLAMVMALAGYWGVQVAFDAFLPTEKPLPAGTIAAQLAVYNNEEDALRGFTILQEQVPEVLSPFKPTLQTHETRVRLLVAPFASRAEAQALCKRMQEHKQACLVRTF